MNSAQTDDEYLDLVDTSDKVIGKKRRSEVYSENLSNFRVINAFIINSQGQLWIPRRTASKRVYPSCLDVSVGGHVESGETYDETFKREAQEELNIDIEKVPYHLLGILTPFKNSVSAYMHVYEIQMNKAPDFNTEDFTEYFWWYPDELLKNIEQGNKAKSDLPKIVKYFYLKK